MCNERRNCSELKEVNDFFAKKKTFLTILDDLFKTGAFQEVISAYYDELNEDIDSYQHFMSERLQKKADEIWKELDISKELYTQMLFKSYQAETYQRWKHGDLLIFLKVSQNLKKSKILLQNLAKTTTNIIEEQFVLQLLMSLADLEDIENDLAMLMKIGIILAMLEEI